MVFSSFGCYTGSQIKNVGFVSIWFAYMLLISRDEVNSAVCQSALFLGCRLVFVIVIGNGT